MIIKNLSSIHYYPLKEEYKNKEKKRKEKLKVTEKYCIERFFLRCFL